MTSILGKRYCATGSIHDYITGDRAKVREAIVRNVLPSATMIRVPCLCRQSEANDIPLATIDRWGLPARTVLCGHCGLIRVDPRWDDETYVRIYREYFWPLQVGFFDITRERFDLSVRRAAPFAQFLTSHVNMARKSLLEIGCSYGAGLTSLKETGAELTGYDYDNRCLTYGRTFSGLDLRTGGIPEATNEGKQYDVVVLRHVLEHFLNPLAECMMLKSLLKEKGVLLVEVPGIFNLDDVGNDPLMYFNAFHTFSFSLTTLTNLMNSCSFTKIYGDEKVNSLWIIAEREEEIIWDNPLLANSIIKYLKADEKKRDKPIRFSIHLRNRLSSLLRDKFK